MKVMVISDLHGSLTYTRKALALFDTLNADLLMILGDYLYHGPRNPLPEGYDPKTVAELLNARQNVILGIRGNCDSEVDQMVLSFDIMADHTTLLLGEHRIFAAHGHRHNPESLPFLKPGDAFLFGHIHIPVAERKNGIVLLNPGSVSLPKNNTPHTCGVLEDGKFTIYTLDQEVYASVDL